MGRSVAHASDQHQVNTLDLPLIGATPRSQQTVNSTDGAWILPLIVAAVEKSIGHKAAAIDAGIDKAQWSRNLAGDGHLSIRRLGLLGEEFWLALIDELRAHFKLDNDEQQLTRAFDGIRAGLSVIERVARKGIR